MARRNLMTAEIDRRIGQSEEKWQAYFNKSEARWLAEQLDKRMDITDKRIDEVKSEVNKRIDATDKRIDEVRNEVKEVRIEVKEVRVELSNRIDRLDDKIDRLDDRLDSNRKFSTTILISVIIGFISMLVAMLLGFAGVLPFGG